MYKARYYKADGKKGRARALPDTLFDGVVHEAVMHQVVKAYLSNQRQGTAAAKTRSEVQGGSSKPWRQKGTGRARQGTIRAVQWEGGGIAFPPIQHSWRQRLPKKVRSLARRSALNDRAGDDRVVIADLPKTDAPKTKELVAYVAGLGAEGKVLLLTNGTNENVYLSSRNVPRLKVLPFGEESAYDVLWAETVVIERSALEDAAETDASKDDASKDDASEDDTSDDEEGSDG
jgi:large subunit ribosomal protein L4